MARKYGLSLTEYEIMDFLWAAKKKLLFKEILLYFNTEKKKKWKKQTLNTFLRKLQDSKVISSELQGNKLVYYPTLSKEEFIYMWNYKNLEDSLTDLFIAFTGHKNLESEEADTLYKYLKQYKNNNINNVDDK